MIDIEFFGYGAGIVVFGFLCGLIPGVVVGVLRHLSRRSGGV